MYYNGAEGDQSPVLTEKSGPYENIRRYGTQMAKEAFNLYSKIIPKNTSKFSYCYKTVVLPSKSAHPDFMKTGGAEYGLDEQTVKIVMDMLGPDQTGLGCVSIGDMVIAGVPGEMTAELGLMIKKAVRETGINHVTIGGLANEWISYILTRKQYELGGGYESSVSFYGAGLGEQITGEVIQLSIQCANAPGS